MSRAWGLFLLAAGCAAPPSPDEEALLQYQEAGALFAEGRYAEAAPLYEKVVAVRDRVKDAWFRLSECRERMGDRAGAADALERLLRADGRDDEALRRLERLKGSER